MLKVEKGVSRFPHTTDQNITRRLVRLKSIKRNHTYKPVLSNVCRPVRSDHHIKCCEHRCIVGPMIDAAAIFPLDAASHCGYEEENREKRKHFSRLLLTFPLGKPLEACHRACESTLKFRVVNCCVYSHV